MYWRNYCEWTFINTFWGISVLVRFWTKYCHEVPKWHCCTVQNGNSHFTTIIHKCANHKTAFTYDIWIVKTLLLTCRWLILVVSLMGFRIQDTNLSTSVSEFLSWGSLRWEDPLSMWVGFWTEEEKAGQLAFVCFLTRDYVTSSLTLPWAFLWFSGLESQNKPSWKLLLSASWEK